MGVLLSRHHRCCLLLLSTTANGSIVFNFTDCFYFYRLLNNNQYLFLWALHKCTTLHLFLSATFSNHFFTKFIYFNYLFHFVQKKWKSIAFLIDLKMYFFFPCLTTVVKIETMVVTNYNNLRQAITTIEFWKMYFV